jgi:glycosyltransferase involved in cell wall biosynthesis
VPKKGFNILLKALSLIPNSLNWRWVHVGGGQELDNLKKYSQNLGLEKRIVWRGACDQGEVFKEYRSADIFILPSIIAEDGDRDGLPNVVMEAASQELCCITSDVAALSEFIIHKKTGWLVPPDNPNVLAQAIIDLSSDYKLRKSLGTNNYERLKADFCHRSGVNIILENLQVPQGSIIDNTNERVT